MDAVRAAHLERVGVLARLGHDGRDGLVERSQDEVGGSPALEREPGVDDVAAGDVLMTVYAPESRLEARLFLSPDNAGMVAVGQRVELQLRAYPHQYFGTRSAVVTAISTIVLPPGEIDADLPVKGPVFVVRARLRHARIEARSRSWTLPPGTSFQADLVRARWPLYRWVLRSVAGDPARS